MTETVDPWFMQDGADPLRAHESRDIVQELFHDRVICLSFESVYVRDVQWPRIPLTLIHVIINFRYI